MATRRRFWPRQCDCRFLMLAVLVGISAMLLLPAVAEAAQFNATVRGKVTNVDGDPIEGVTVTIRPRAVDPSNPRDPVVLTTDDDGNYYARNVPLGRHILTFEFEGLQSIEEAREFRAGPTRVDVTMKAVEVPEEFLRAQVANENYGAGVDAFNAGNYAETVTLMNASLASLDDVAENAEALSYVYALLGAAYSRQRMFDEAIEAFRKRLAYAPDDAEANLDLGQALADSGDTEASEQFFEKALALDPDDAISQYNAGVTMVNAGDVAGGIARIERAIELQPEYPLAYKNLGYAYARIEEYAKAIAAFETYVKQDPDADDVAQINDFIVALKEMIGE